MNDSGYLAFPLLRPPPRRASGLSRRALLSAGHTPDGRVGAYRATSAIPMDGHTQEALAGDEAARDRRDRAVHLYAWTAQSALITFPEPSSDEMPSSRA
jgi:hypothetical protein